MSNSTLQFLTDLRAKYNGDPEGLLHELDDLLAKAKSNEQSLESPREAAEAAYVDEIAASHLNGTTAPKMPVGLAALRDSEAAAEHLVNTLAAARQLAWGDVRSTVGPKLHEQCVSVGQEYLDRAARALALIRAGHTAYQMVTGGEVSDGIIHQSRPRFAGQTDLARAHQKFVPFQRKAADLNLSWDLSHDQFIGAVGLDLKLDPLAADVAAKFLNQEI